MVSFLKEKFEDPSSDYLNIPNNRLLVKLEELKPFGEQTFNIEDSLKVNGFEGKRVVMGALANNECLPFTDGSFDCYLGNLSLMLVDNYKNML